MTPCARPAHPEICAVPGEVLSTPMQTQLAEFGHEQCEVALTRTFFWV